MKTIVAIGLQSPMPRDFIKSILNSLSFRNFLIHLILKNLTENFKGSKVLRNLKSQLNKSAGINPGQSFLSLDENQTRCTRTRNPI